MKNFTQPGMVVSVTAPLAVTSGQGVIIGNLFGVACHDAANGAPLEIATEGIFELPKLSTDNIGVGARLAWDNASTPKQLRLDVTGRVVVAVAVAAAAASTTTVLAKLMGSTPAGT